MKKYIDCVPCFFKQALEAVRLAGAGKRAAIKEGGGGLLKVVRNSVLVKDEGGFSFGRALSVKM